MMTCTKCKRPIEPKTRYHRTKKGPHHQNCMSAFAAPAGSAPNSVLSPKESDELKDVCLLKVVKERDELAEALRCMILRADYVCAHRYGKTDPVGTRIVAVEDLRSELQRASKVWAQNDRTHRPPT